MGSDLTSEALDPTQMINIKYMLQERGKKGRRKGKKRKEGKDERQGDEEGREVQSSKLFHVMCAVKNF